MEQQGLWIKEQNFRCRSGEIDLIARDGKYLVFVEVKYRHTAGSGRASAAVNNKKQKMISRAAVFYLVRYGYPEDTPCRFDVVGISLDRAELVRNAFAYQR